MNVYFEIRISEVAKIEDSCIMMPVDTFPEPFPELPSNQRLVYEGVAEFILIGGGTKRVVEFLLDLRDLQKTILVRLRENGCDVAATLYSVMEIPELHETGGVIPVLFMGNTSWLVRKLVPKVQPGKTIKGIRRLPLPPELHFVKQFFTKAV